MPGSHDDATLPGPEGSTEPKALSRAGQVLFRSLEQRMFGQSEPQRLGRYHLIDTLGRGAMGIVYRAYDPDLDRRVAIKVVTLDGAEARARMVREAKALAKLNHPNVVTVHEVGEDGDDLFVVMEYVDAGTLLDWIREHPTSEGGRVEVLLELLLQALEGLAAAHELGLVHRDIKPANMLVGTDGRLRIADFGLARGMQIDQEVTVDDAPAGNSAITQDGQLVGTPSFMAPEQLRGVANARSDQFSLAVSFYLAFYGRRPYAADSLAQLIDVLETERFEAPRSSDVPDFVRKVLLRAMRAKPEERFSDAHEMARALRAGGRRRKRIFGGAAVGAIAVSIAGVGWATTPEACSDGRARAEAAVTSHADRIEQLVYASGRPYPKEVLGGFEADLESLVDRWSEQYLEACRDARVREPELAALGERRLHCLDDGLAAVEQALLEIDALTPAQADVLPNTSEFLLGIVDCDEPDERLTGERGRELVATFRAGKMAEGRFEFEEAREIYASIISATEPREFPSLRAEVHIRLAAVAENVEDQDAFERHVMASLADAERAGEPALVALGWLQVAEFLPLDGPENTFELFVSLSHAARERGALTDFDLANLGYREGNLRAQRGQFDEALRLLREAREPAERSSNIMLPHLLVLESMVVQRTGELQLAEELTEEAIENWAARVGMHHPDIATWQMHLADVQSWKGEDVRSIETLDAAIETLSERPNYRTANLFHALNGRGDAKRNIGRLEDALVDYDRALALAAANPEATIPVLSVTLSKARALWMMARHDEALVLLDEVLGEIRPQTVHDHDVRADAGVLRASVLADVGRDDEARRQVDEAVPWVEEAFGTEGVMRLQSAVQLAEVWIALEDYERALEEIDRFLPLAEDDLMFRAMLEGVRAECLRDQGKREQARVWAEKALATMKASSAGEHEYVEIQAVLDSLNEGDPRGADPDGAAPGR